MREREAAAYHEAGHFIARTVLMPDVWCMRVTIVPGGSVLGDSEIPGEYPMGVAPARESAEALATVLYAGAAAELRFRWDPEAVARSARADSRLARELLRLVDSESHERVRREEELRTRAADLVEGHWWEVGLIARALLAHETLAGEEAESILAASAVRAPRDHRSVLHELPRHRHDDCPQCRAQVVDLFAVRWRRRASNT